MIKEWAVFGLNCPLFCVQRFSGIIHYRGTPCKEKEITEFKNSQSSLAPLTFYNENSIQMTPELDDLNTRDPVVL